MCAGSGDPRRAWQDDQETIETGEAIMIFPGETKNIPVQKTSTNLIVGQCLFFFVRCCKIDEKLPLFNWR
jgi:hypothetical protein